MGAYHTRHGCSPYSIRLNSGETVDLYMDTQTGETALPKEETSENDDNTSPSGVLKTVFAYKAPDGQNR